MSMLGTLGKVTIGILVAKGVGTMMRSGSSSHGSLLDGLGGLLNGGTNKGGLGGLLGSLGEGSIQQGSTLAIGNNNDFARMFNDAIQGKEPEPTAEQDQQAEILLHAMVSAAKADGKIDEAEQNKILAQFKEASEKDAEMIRQEVEAPLAFQELIKSVPKGMEQQVYLVSLLAIDLDNEAEVRYLERLAKELNISSTVSNEIHDRLGAPLLYA